jgi:hypothetical protein
MSGRMTAIPQLGPEVFVDDDNDATKPAKTNLSPFLSPDDRDSTPRSSFIAHGLDGAMRERMGANVPATGFSSFPVSPLSSPGVSPQRSPHKASNSAISIDTGGAGGSAHSSRRGSAAENVLEVLDNSAWGESIRRSFTVRRPSQGGSS